MAKETLDAAVADNPGLKPEQSSQTDGLLLEGAHGWTPTMYIKLVQDLGVDTVLAEHLSETYGDRAFEVGRLASRTGKRWPVVGVRLHPEYPYIEAEVSYFSQGMHFSCYFMHHFDMFHLSRIVFRMCRLRT